MQETEQRSAPEPVDQRHRHDGKCQVDQAHQRGLHEGSVGTNARLLEDHRRIEEHGVDARDLLQDADRNADRHDEPQ
jgi:hypothetical protein